MRDAGIIDYYWGPGFFVIAVGWVVSRLFVPALLLSQAWWRFGLRDLRGIWWRDTGKSRTEDARYAAMRRAGGTSFWWKSLFTIFLLQGILQWIIASPLHAAFLLPQTGGASDGVFLFGMLLLRRDLRLNL